MQIPHYQKEEFASSTDENVLSLTSIRNQKKNEDPSNFIACQTKPTEYFLKSQKEVKITVSTVQDLIAGGVAGTAGVIVGHPFDTIKVRQQLGGTTESFPSLFRGMFAPMSTAAVVNAIIFSSFGWSSRIWDETAALERYNSYKTFSCGCFAGFTKCFVQCPMEHIKCRLQVQEHTAKSVLHTSTHKPQPIFRGPYQLSSHIINQYGVSTLFRGWTATCWREIPAFGIYFSMYDACKETIVQTCFTLPDYHSSKWAWTASALAGGISGISAWTVVYPIDVIKTRIQTSSFDSTRPQDRKIWFVANQIIKERGIRSMFRGLGITIARAFPVNGIIFPVYEFTVAQLAT